MHPIKFIARIQYEVFGGRKSMDLEFLASSKDDAKLLARKLFKAELDFNTADNIQVGVKYATPTEHELTHIRSRLTEVLDALRLNLNGNSYLTFLQNYTKFQGYNFKSDTNIESYMIKFEGFEIKLTCDGEVTMVDDEEIIYHSVTFNRDYVILDNGVTILCGS